VNEFDPKDDRESKQPVLDVRGRPDLEFPGRRSFIVMLVAAGTVFVGALLAVPLVMFATDPLFRKTSGTNWSDASPLSDFADIKEPAEPIIQVESRDGWRLAVSKKPVFVMPRKAGTQHVFSSICPHLGCQVEWAGDQHQFYCPCHGSVFAEAIIARRDDDGHSHGLALLRHSRVVPSRAHLSLRHDPCVLISQSWRGGAGQRASALSPSGPRRCSIPANLDSIWRSFF
jgi:Rieske Fe-S protein